MTINVRDVLRDVPHFEVFCSVEKVLALVERLRADSRFSVEVAGSSVNGVPIHYVRFGKGSVKALIIGGPHAMEPVGSLTVFSLLSLLQQGNHGLLQADVEWHVVPCVDPDGAILNEGWSQKPFTLENYIRHYYVQPRPYQVDFSFPISHKKMIFDQPSKEAQVLRGILDRVRPDFCFSLHNSLPMGGAWFHLTRDIGQGAYAQIYELLKEHRLTLWGKSRFDQYSEGMRPLSTLKDHYDLLEKQGAAIPEEYLRGGAGASSQEYLLQIKPDALVFIAELPYGVHPGEVSENETGENLRQLRLRLYADNLFVAATILEEWERVKPDLDAVSPFYRKIHGELVLIKDKLVEGVSAWYQHPLQYLLFLQGDSRIATERERVQIYTLSRMHFLGSAYAFVRLLNTSKQTPGVRQAIERLARIFDGALDGMKKHLDFSAYEVISCDRLAKVQLGCGLIALNSVLETNGNAEE